MTTTALVAEERAADNKTRIFILGETNPYLDGLAHQVRQNGDYELVACVEPGKGCFEQFVSLCPNVLLVNHKAVSRPAKEFFDRFHNADPTVSILVFGSDMGEEFLTDIIRSGAQGYVDERTGIHQLYNAIHTVSNDRLWVERQVMNGLVGAPSIGQVATRAIRDHMDRVNALLNDREMQVFSLVLEGLNTKDMADRMHLSEQSIKLYLSRLFRKFDVANRSQLILMILGRLFPVGNLVEFLKLELDRRHTDRGQPSEIQTTVSESAPG